MSVYPPRDAERLGQGKGRCEALITAVLPASPADDAGFEPGCRLTSVDGHPLRDIIDWRWYASEDVVELGYIDNDGEAGEIELERFEGEDWGFEFDGVVFDGIKQCRNACTFCFMRQLPDDVRSSLVLRDDDFRLSFLAGTFVTFTNLTAEDEQRIIEQRISPLRVSLHVSNAEARVKMIGKHAAHGLAALERLLAAGIEMHAQIVLVPGQNDGELLKETLAWAYARPGIVNIGIVPLGFTKHQTTFVESFNDADRARAVLDVVVPFQQRSLEERNTPWVFAADEFYRNAYRACLEEHVPPASYYGDFSLFEDGIGIVRSFLDDWHAACADGGADACAEALRQSGFRAFVIVGQAMEPLFTQLVAKSSLAGLLVPLAVDNDYFGGNVDVTGLLCGCDIVRAVRERAEAEGRDARLLFNVMSVVFNDDGVTLDDMSLEEMGIEARVALRVVSCNPSEFLPSIASAASSAR